MKKIRILMLLMAVLTVVACFVACGNVETTAEITTTETPVTTLPPLTAFESLKIAGNDLSESTIVYAESPYAKQAAERPNFFPVYDFDKESAERLSDLIYSVTGKRLPIALDTNTEVTDKEILVGETNRPDTKSVSLNKVKVDEFILRENNGKLIVCGGIYGTTWHSIDYLETLFNDQLTKRNATFDFAAEYEYKGKHKMIRIGCIGDSITQGVGVDDASICAYPAQLSRLLWKDALVTNFGLSGKTMRDDLADSYMSTTTYTRALTSASSIDIFTVMLGTNDSNRDRNWTNTSTQKYKNSCKTLFESLISKNKNLRFVIANCPAYFGTDAFGSLQVRRLQEQLVDEMNALGYKTSFFNMYEVTKPLEAYYPDKLHPNGEGHIFMANAFAESLQKLIDEQYK